VVFGHVTSDELRLRGARALARKRSKTGPFQLCNEGVRAGGKQIALSATEVRILAELVRARGAAVSRDELARAIDGDRFAGRALDAHVYRLRRKLRDVPGAHLETVRQRGFRLQVEPAAS
jgi:DNA-binding response OmpR family regulator